MNPESERPMDGRDWAEAYLTPVPARRKPIDLAKARRIEDRVGTIVLRVFAAVMVGSALTGSVLAWMGVL